MSTTTESTSIETTENAGLEKQKNVNTTASEDSSAEKAISEATTSVEDTIGTLLTTNNILIFIGFLAVYFGYSYYKSGGQTVATAETSGKGVSMIIDIIFFMILGLVVYNIVSSETNSKDNNVTGKFIEMLLVATASYILFAFLGLPYAVLIAILVGLSVIIPIFGAILVTIPVVLIGLYEWGLSENFYWLLGFYLLIQILDGNVLVPILFSTRNNLHPVVIIIAVLFFGGIWGFWGLFFAIPLATFVKAIINSWPEPIS